MPSPLPAAIDAIPHGHLKETRKKVKTGSGCTPLPGDGTHVDSLTTTVEKARKEPRP